MNSEPINLSPGERALIERLRSGKPFRVAINYGPGLKQWTVTTAPSLPASDPVNTGGGNSFDDAWEHCHR
ncbi:hypothetical protein IVB22_33180 [Bradyrhizobium sp. 190]|uniref:hypothetical protein n=1 Tax=Bradyrhizobium sp. 190 TaxID=2782658 RepID=UPI001FFB1E6E|nr:hypothetical protein [Bradyrhizobium sp. 190]MCK1517274.1 hypothetical protein [Bradyrhizobium sp. 190]